MGKIPGRHLTAKILALILATVLWLYVMNEQNPPVETTLTVPLEVRNLASSYTITDVPETVKVKVRGPRSIVAGVLVKDIKSYIDVKGLDEGRQSVKVHTVIPASLELLEVNPDPVSIRLDKPTSRDIPVDVKLSGATPASVTVGQVVPTPSHVTIAGLKSQVEAVDKVVATVDVAGKTESFSTSVHVVMLNNNGKEIEGLNITPDKVNVAVTIVQGIVKKTVNVKPIVYGTVPANVEIKQVTAFPDKIEINGTAEDVRKIDFIYTEPLGVADVTKDTTKEVRLQLKEGITAAQNTVTVQIIAGPKQ